MSYGWKRKFFHLQTTTKANDDDDVEDDDINCHACHIQLSSSFNKKSSISLSFQLHVREMLARSMSTPQIVPNY